MHLKLVSYGYAMAGLTMCMIVTGSAALARAAEDTTSPEWAALEGDEGVVLQPVLACRTGVALENIVDRPEESRSLLARMAAKRGSCTKLEPGQYFWITRRWPSVLQIRTAAHGGLWVAKVERVPSLDGITSGGRLSPEKPSDTEPVSGLTVEERRAVEAELSELPTTSGFVRPLEVGDPDSDPSSKESANDSIRNRECFCANGMTIRAQRSCREACASITELGVRHCTCDQVSCFLGGERVSAREAGRRCRPQGAQRAQ